MMRIDEDEGDEGCGWLISERLEYTYNDNGSGTAMVLGKNRWDIHVLEQVDNHIPTDSHHQLHTQIPLRNGGHK